LKLAVVQARKGRPDIAKREKPSVTMPERALSIQRWVCSFEMSGSPPPARLRADDVLIVQDTEDHCTAARAAILRDAYGTDDQSGAYDAQKHQEEKATESSDHASLSLPLPNGWRLSGDGGEADGVRCSRGLGAAPSMGGSGVCRICLKVLFIYLERRSEDALALHEAIPSNFKAYCRRAAKGVGTAANRPHHPINRVAVNPDAAALKQPRTNRNDVPVAT
jgi:hypothetical protein